MDHSSKASLLAVFSRSAYFPTDCWLVWLLLSWRGRQQEFLFIFFRRKMKSVANFRRICYGARRIQCAYHAKASCTASGSGASSSEAGFHYPYSLFFTNSSRLGGSGTVAADRVSGTRRILGSILATTIGAGLVAASTSSEIAFAEKNNNENHRSYNVDAKSTTEKNVDMEKVVRQERERVEERLRKSDLQGIVLPSFTIAAKGQQVAVRFQVPPSCDISHLIIDVVSHLGLKTDDSGGGSEMILRAWDSAVARQLILAHPDQHVTKDFGKDQRLEILKEETLSHRTIDGNNICILVFEPLIGSNNAEVEFLKRGSFTVKELDALVSALRIAGGSANARRATQKKHREASKHRDRQSSGPNLSSDAKALEALEAMGVKIYGLETANGSSDNDGVSWDNIAGYHEQKREIEDTILLTLRRPEIYDNIARGTRRKFESNRPRAVLFEGPPGTGKTSCARVIASQAGVPLLYVPLEVVMSKYYGESERMLGTVFTLANELPDGAIIFLDEVDSFAAARDKEMHEATRRILSVLLRQIDGFEQEKRVVVIAATNRKQDLDPALISRFDLSVTFNLPDQQTREEIAAQYARHLSTQELATFAAVTEGMSGRDLRDICQQAERHWASKLIRGQVGDSSMHGLPPIQEYMECAMKRQQTLHKWHVEENSFMGDDQRAGSQMKKWPSVVV